MNEADVTIAARTAYEAVRAYRSQIGMADMVPWIDAGGTKQSVFEQAVKDVSKGKHRPIVNIEEVLITAVTTAVLKWRGDGDVHSTR